MAKRINGWIDYNDNDEIVQIGRFSQDSENFSTEINSLKTSFKKLEEKTPQITTTYNEKIKIDNKDYLTDENFSLFMRYPADLNTSFETTTPEYGPYIAVECDPEKIEKDKIWTGDMQYANFLLIVEIENNLDGWCPSFRPYARTVETQLEKGGPSWTSSQQPLSKGTYIIAFPIQISSFYDRFGFYATENARNIKVKSVHLYKATDLNAHAYSTTYSNYKKIIASINGLFPYDNLGITSFDIPCVFHTGYFKKNYVIIRQGGDTAVYPVINDLPDPEVTLFNINSNAENFSKLINEELNEEITSLKNQIITKASLSEVTTLKNAINTLNGNGDGSVEKTVNNAINNFATAVSNDNVVNSYKELIDWAAEHGSEATEMAANIQTNTSNINALKESVGDIPQNTNVISYIDEAIEDLNETLQSYYTKNEADNTYFKKIDAPFAYDGEHLQITSDATTFTGQTMQIPEINGSSTEKSAVNKGYVDNLITSLQEANSTLEQKINSLETNINEINTKISELEENLASVLASLTEE